MIERPAGTDGHSIRPGIRTATVALSTLAAIAGCATPSAPGQVATLQVVCPAGGDLVQCFAPASALCGRDGYDLVDARGRPVSVGDARYGVLQARCRGRRQAGQ
jgi:hypothetical protein